MGMEKLPLLLMGDWGFGREKLPLPLLIGDWGLGIEKEPIGEAGLGAVNVFTGVGGLGMEKEPLVGD